MIIEQEITRLISLISTPNQTPIKLEDLAYQRRIPKIISQGDHKESQFKIHWGILTPSQAKGCPRVKRNQATTTIADRLDRNYLCQYKFRYIEVVSKLIIVQLNSINY